MADEFRESEALWHASRRFFGMQKANESIARFEKCICFVSNFICFPMSCFSSLLSFDFFVNT